MTSNLTVSMIERQDSTRASLAAIDRLKFRLAQSTPKSLVSEAKRSILHLATRGSISLSLLTSPKIRSNIKNRNRQQAQSLNKGDWPLLTTR